MSNPQQKGIPASQILGFVSFVLGVVVVLCNLGGMWDEANRVGMWFYMHTTSTYAVSTFMAVVGGFFYFKKY